MYSPVLDVWFGYTSRNIFQFATFTLLTFSVPFSVEENENKKYNVPIAAMCLYNIQHEKPVFRKTLNHLITEKLFTLHWFLQYVFVCPLKAPQSLNINLAKNPQSIVLQMLYRWGDAKCKTKNFIYIFLNHKIKK